MCAVRLRFASSKRETESVKVAIIDVFIIRPIGGRVSWELWVNG